MNKFISEVHSLGGELVNVSSQAGASVERIKMRTGAVDQQIISDFDKQYCSAYDLLIAWQDHPEHKDTSMSQPAVFVINSNAELVFEWKADKPGPLGRPIPTQLVQAVISTVEEHGPSFKKNHLAVNLKALAYGGLVNFVNSMISSILKVGLSETMSRRFGPEWYYMMFYILYKEGVYSVMGAQFFKEFLPFLVLFWVLLGWMFK